MTEPKGVSDLEAALIDRAERLASEYLQKGKDGREAIINEERDRLRTREERIADEAKADADRVYRRRVQAAQLKVQASLDRERWQLIESVIDELPQALASIAADDETYTDLLQHLLAQGATSIGEDDLVVSLNARDRGRLEARWQEFVDQAAPGRHITLDMSDADISGGIRVSSADGRVSIDASFEGRTERFRNELVQVIAERLFANA